MLHVFDYLLFKILPENISKSDLLMIKKSLNETLMNDIDLKNEIKIVVIEYASKLAMAAPL